MTGIRPTARGVVLIVVLWVVAILAVVCLALGGTVQFKQVHLRRSRSELTARQALLSATALAKDALLADDLAAETPTDGWAGEGPDPFTLELGATEVRLFSPSRRWGLEDESARLNGNTASAEMLARLPGMTSSAAEAFVSARASAEKGRTGEGLLACPTGLTGPYATPLQLAEALVAALVETGLHRPGEPGGTSVAGGGQPGSWVARMQFPPPAAEAMKYLTVYSRQRNLDAQARRRVNVNTASRAELAAAVGEHFAGEQIDAILLARDLRPFQSIGELLTRTMEIQDAEGNTKTIRIGREQLKPVADRLTATEAAILPGLVNVNTAPAEVLRCLPGLTAADVSAIIARRAALAGGASGTGETPLASVGWLLDVLNDRTFAEVCRFVTTRSQQFRMHAEARPLAPGEISPAGWFSLGAARPARQANSYAMAVLERDAGRCSVLLWLTWTEASGAAGSASESPPGGS